MEITNMIKQNRIIKNENMRLHFNKNTTPFIIGIPKPDAQGAKVDLNRTL